MKWQHTADSLAWKISQCVTLTHISSFDPALVSLIETEWSQQPKFFIFKKYIYVDFFVWLLLLFS